MFLLKEFIIILLKGISLISYYVFYDLQSSVSS